VKILPALGDTETDRDLGARLLLLMAQARLALDPDSLATPPASAAILRRLRTDYPQTPAAVYSYIIEAKAAEKRGQLDEAQALLDKLATDYKDNKTHAPYALYQIALYAGRREQGQRQDYLDAYNRLEELVTNPDYKDSPYIFYARLEQANLARLLGNFGTALNLCNDLVNKYKFPQFPDALRADLALADTNSALIPTDASRAENAAAIYQRLLDQQSAPVDLRVEAGYKFGLSLIKRDDTTRLITIWGQMIRHFLLDDASRAAKLRESAQGSYWMARILLDLGTALEKQDKITEARNLYELLLRHNLPGAAIAQARLDNRGK